MCIRPPVTVHRRCIARFLPWVIRPLRFMTRGASPSKSLSPSATEPAKAELDANEERLRRAYRSVSLRRVNAAATHMQATGAGSLPYRPKRIFRLKPRLRTLLPRNCAIASRLRFDDRLSPRGRGRTWSCGGPLLAPRPLGSSFRERVGCDSGPFEVFSRRSFFSVRRLSLTVNSCVFPHTGFHVCARGHTGCSIYAGVEIAPFAAGFWSR